ncbi:germination protein, Ger(x)C family [Paenibacillaceae bacterium GAS479]|nr:germination protein, Ger(x)C family [Paenibacillaceae bacterium GAS479]
MTLLQRTQRPTAMLAAALCLLLTGGCWDSKDVDNRMLVGAIGIESTKDGRLNAWFRMPLTTSTIGNEKDTFFSLIQHGETVMDAINKLQYKLPKALDVSSTRAVMLSKDIANTGLMPYLEFAVRDRSVPLDAVIAIVDGNMHSIFVRSNPIGELTGIYAKLYFEPYAGGIPRKNKAMLWEVYSKLLNPLQANLIPVLKEDKKSLFTQIGNAYFVEDKIAGMLTMDETLIYEMITQRLVHSEIVLMSRSDLKVVHKKTRIKTKLVNGKPVIKVSIWVSVALTDKSHREINVTENTIKTELNELLQKLTQSMLKKTQSSGSDIVGFGNWYRGRLSPDKYTSWPELYREADIDVEYHVRLRNTGLQFLD